MDGYGHMNQPGGLRNGRGHGLLLSLPAVPGGGRVAPTRHVPADRLADVCSLVRSASPAAPARRRPHRVSQRTSVAGPSIHAVALAGAPSRSVPAVRKSAVRKSAVPKTGRRRSEAPRQLGIPEVPAALRMVVVTVSRLTVMGALVALVAITTALGVLKAWE